MPVTHFAVLKGRYEETLSRYTACGLYPAGKYVSSFSRHEVTCKHCKKTKAFQTVKKLKVLKPERKDYILKLECIK